MNRATRRKSRAPRQAPVTLFLLLVAGLAACAEPYDDGPTLEGLEPATIPEATPLVLRAHGERLDEPGLKLRLEGPERLDLVLLGGRSEERASAFLPRGLRAGTYDLLASFESGAVRRRRAALEVVREEQTDVLGPEVWLVAPNPAEGVRAGSWVELEIYAQDENGVAEIGFRTEGRVEVQESRRVSSGGTRAWARFPFYIPEDLRPLQLFWVVPTAVDRLGNPGVAQFAASMIICEDGSPSWPCPE